MNSHRNNKPQDRIVFRSQQLRYIVNLKDICYLQARGCYTKIFLIDGRKIVMSRPLKYHQELLPDNSFLRIHQSYLVNKQNIRSYYWKEGLLCLKDGTQLPVSARKKTIVRSFFKFLEGLL